MAEDSRKAFVLGTIAGAIAPPDQKVRGACSEPGLVEMLMQHSPRTPPGGHGGGRGPGLVEGRCAAKGTRARAHAHAHAAPHAHLAQDAYAQYLAQDESGAIAAFLDDGSVNMLQVRTRFEGPLTALLHTLQGARRRVPHAWPCGVAWPGLA